VSFDGKDLRREPLAFAALSLRSGCGILLAAALVALAGTPTRGQTVADDQAGNAYSFEDAADATPSNDLGTFLLTNEDSGAFLSVNVNNGCGDAPVLFACATPVGQDNGADQQKPVPLNQKTVETPLVVPYEPITGRQRLGWIVRTTLWPEHSLSGIVTAGGGTGLNRPHEDGPHWGGFAERFGVRLTGVATSNVMEAGFGALWGEDPRYFRVPEYSFSARVKNTIKMTFMARRPDGHFALAYARFMAIPGNNFLSNAWRPDSEANITDAVLRTAEGFAGHLLGNVWFEFWPTAKEWWRHRGGEERSGGSQARIP
jgi:hypothetical protein